jgi:hypothetical protein
MIKLSKNIIFILFIYLLELPGPEVDSACNRNEYQKSLKIKKPGGKVRPALRADNLAAIY